MVTLSYSNDGWSTKATAFKVEAGDVTPLDTCRLGRGSHWWIRP